MAFSFHSEGINYNLKQKAKLKAWLASVISKEKKIAGEINYLFTTDEYVLGYNKRFLKHNTYTDIITFHRNEGRTVNGDILISIERVRENAQKFEVPFEEELRRVLVHGVLHLCGIGDKKAEEVTLMRKKEETALRLFSKSYSG